MSNFPLVRAKSSVCLPRERDIRTARDQVATLSRLMIIFMIVINVFVDEDGDERLKRARPSSPQQQNKDETAASIVSQPSFHWVDTRYNARRYADVDPIPNYQDLGGSFHLRYKWAQDWLNPLYWRKYRDPYYDTPLWSSWRPWQFDHYNVDRAVKMYKQGLISFNLLDKKWLEPTALGRRCKDWGDIYTRGAFYGPRRYFYQFAA